MYTISINKEDLSYIIAAIGQRAELLQGSLMTQARDNEEKQTFFEEEEKRAALPDPFAVQFEAIEPTFEPPKVVEKPEVSRKAKRAALMRILKSKGAADLSTAEIARRAGVSYVTAHKARAAFGKKGRK